MKTTRKQKEILLVGIGTLLFGIAMVILGIILFDGRLWIPVLFSMDGTFFAIYACQYLEREVKKWRR